MLWNLSNRLMGKWLRIWYVPFVFDMVLGTAHISPNSKSPIFFPLAQISNHCNSVYFFSGRKFSSFFFVIYVLGVLTNLICYYILLLWKRKVNSCAFPKHYIVLNVIYWEFFQTFYGLCFFFFFCISSIYIFFCLP